MNCARAIAAAVVLSGCAGADQAGAYLESCLARYNIPALSAAVTHRGKRVKIGSISKHFTAVGVLLMAEEGRLQLDDPLSGHRQHFHNGSTVAGYSAVMYELPDDGLSVAVLCSIDRGPAVNAIAMRLADFYVPGVSIQGLAARPDPDAERTRKLTGMLREVGADGRSPLLRDSWKIAAKMGSFKRAAFPEFEE